MNVAQTPYAHRSHLQPWLRAFLLLFVFCVAAAGRVAGQTTNVTGTVTDANGLPYSGATLRAGLVNSNGVSFTSPATVTIASNATCQAAGLGPAPCQAPFPTSQGPFTLDANGGIPLGGIVLEDNSLVSPGGTLWKFTILEPGIPPPGGFGPQTFSVNISISGPSQNIGATLSAGAPALSRIGGAGGGLPALPTSPNSVPQILSSTPTGGVGGPSAWGLQGIPGRSVAGTSDTIAATDRSSTVQLTSATAVTETLPAAATLGSNFSFAPYVSGAGIVTVSSSSNINSAASIAIGPNNSCVISSPDNATYIARCAYGPVIIATSAAFATATTAGTCVQNVTAVAGATTGMAVAVSPVSTPGVGAQWAGFVSSAGNVTINECAVAASAGGTIAFNIRVLP